MIDYFLGLLKLVLQATMLLNHSRGHSSILVSFFALSVMHGGPAPMFLSSAVADYIVYGVQRVKATIADVPNPHIQQLLKKVLH